MEADERSGAGRAYRFTRGVVRMGPNVPQGKLAHEAPEAQSSFSLYEAKEVVAQREQRPMWPSHSEFKGWRRSPASFRKP